MLLRELAVGYMRRQRWQAHLQAVETVRLLTESLTGKRTSSPSEYKHVSAGALLGTMGVKL